MTKQEAASLGGKATARIHGIEICPHCNQIMPLSFHQRIGRKGGKIGGGKRNLTHEQCVANGRMGGRGNKKQEARNELS